MTGPVVSLCIPKSEFTESVTIAAGCESNVPYGGPGLDEEKSEGEDDSVLASNSASITSTSSNAPDTSPNDVLLDRSCSMIG